MLTAKQIAFCKEVANGKNATQAYKAAFKTTASGTAKVNASKLLKSKEIKQRIKQLQHSTQKMVEKAAQKAVDEVVLKEVMDKNERMHILTKIARGQIPLFKPMVCDGVIQEVGVVPNWMDRKNAIAEMNKMDGSYEPMKQGHSFTEPTDITLNIS